MQGAAHAHDISTILDKKGVAVRAGQHCARPLMAHLGLNATCRASFGLYNTTAEVDVLIDALELAHDLFARQPPDARSVDQYRRGAKKSSILDLFDKEIGDVCARYDSVPPFRWFAKHLVAPCSWTMQKHTGPGNRPIKAAFLDQLFLQALVVIGTAKNDLKRGALEETNARAAIARPKPSDANKAIDPFVFHRSNQHARCVREQVHRLDKLAQADAKCYNDGINPGKSSLYIVLVQRISLHFLQFRITKIYR